MADKTIKKVYLIGIGGIGISALARYFLSEGWQVSGSDLSPSDTTKELKNEGAKIYIGHQAGHIRANMPITKVIYNQAITEDNPELVLAKKFNIVCRSYPEMVGELTKKYKTIAIAGAHGKSTTTALVSLILIEAGFDPTVIIGTKLKEFSPAVIARSHGRRGNLFSVGSLRSARDDSYGVNFRKGKGDWLVLEADEWKASFLNYFPTLAIVTNIDKEHMDFYKNFSEVKKTFEKFKKQCGKVLTPETNPKILAEIKKVLKIPGQHNLYDASCAYSVAKYLGIPKQIILKALGKYTGAWRRMEYRGELRITKNELRNMNKEGLIHNSSFIIPVYDDYAHHPTEIKATLAGFRERWPKNALICVFQAHQAQRLKLLFKDFKTAFKDADKVIILPTYEVAGREELANSNLSEKLAKEINAIYVKNPKRELKKVLKALLAKTLPTHAYRQAGGRQAYWPNPIIVMMGAGDIFNLTNLLIR